MSALRAEDFEVVRQAALFRDVPLSTLQRLVENSLLQRYPVGTDLFQQGDRPDFAHVILEGSVQLFAAAENGREAVVEILTPGEIFLLAAALMDAPYLMSARVVATGRLLLIPAQTLRRQIVDDDCLALTMMASLAGQFRRMVRQIKDLKLRSSAQRLGCYLLELSVMNDSTQSIVLPYDKRLIAAQLGMTPETLSRAFVALRPMGVRVQGATVSLEDIRLLEEACGSARLRVDEQCSLPR